MLGFSGVILDSRACGLAVPVFSGLVRDRFAFKVGLVSGAGGALSDGANGFEDRFQIDGFLLVFVVGTVANLVGLLAPTLVIALLCGVIDRRQSPVILDAQVEDELRSPTSCWQAAPS